MWIDNQTTFDRSTYQRDYRARNRERIAERNREYYLRNRATRLAQQKEYDAAQKEAKREYDAAYRQTERAKEANRARRDTKERKARDAARSAIKSGRLLKEPCEACGADGPVDAHHDDYDKPLDVRWMCRGCHIAFHEAARGFSPGSV